MKSVNAYNRYCLCLMFFIATSLLLRNIARAENTRGTKAKFITQFPFLLINRGTVIIKAQFGDFPDTLNFILDTGSGGISLDSSTAVHFNITPVKSPETILGIAQRKPATFIMDQSLRLPGLEVSNLNFHVNDYSFLYDDYNLKIDGVIGYSFLKSYVVKINYDTQIMEVWQPGKMQYPKKGFVMPAGGNKIATINATLNDRQKISSRFYFDTGADMCFLLPDKFIKDSNVLSNDKKMVVSEAEGLGGKKNMLLTTIDEFQIGPYTLKKVPAYIFEDSYNVVKYPANAGIIGNGLLQRFNVIINYPDNEIHLVPNSIFKEPFNYAYVGCNIAAVDGRLVVKDLVKDSPAHAAGLNNDDIIFGVNDRFHKKADDYERLFNKTGARLKVFYLRDNQIKSTVVEVKSIL